MCFMLIDAESETCIFKLLFACVCGIRKESNCSGKAVQSMCALDGIPTDGNVRLTPNKKPLPILAKLL